MPRVAIYNTSTDDLEAHGSLGIPLLPGRSTVEADLTDEQLESLKGHGLLQVTLIDGREPTVEEMAPWTAPVEVPTVEVPPGFVASTVAASTPGGVAVIPVAPPQPPQTGDPVAPTPVENTPPPAAPPVVEPPVTQ